MIRHHTRIGLAATLLATTILTSCGGSIDGRPPFPPRPGIFCLQPGGQSARQSVRLTCPVGSLPYGQAACDFFINAVSSSGNVFQIVNVSPNFPPDVPEGDSNNMTITLQSGTQSGNATVQVTQQNCRAQPNCSPQAIAAVTVSSLCPQ